MGRGLSDLQKTILKLAAANAARGVGVDNGVHLYASEVMIAVYDFKVTGWRDTVGSHKFDVSVIGEGKYQAAAAAISRAFARLEARGLVMRYSGAVSHWSGIALTDLGQSTARLLPDQLNG